MKILAYPKFYFCENKYKLVEDQSVALISILNYDDVEKVIEDIPGKSITLFFDDIGHFDKIPDDLLNIYDKLILFNRDHAKKIIEFQKSLSDKIEYIIIHCTAGVSRSGAIATFLQDIYHENDEDNEWFSKNNRHIIPNKHVLKVLNNYINNIGDNLI